MLHRADFEDRRWEIFLRHFRDAKSFRDPAERLRIRKEAKISRGELASVVGCESQTIRTWELGTREPQGEYREKYYDALRDMRDAVAHAKS